MSKDPATNQLNWDDLDDTESDDSEEAGSDNESNDSQEEEKEEKRTEEQFEKLTKGKFGDHKGYGDRYAPKDNYMGDPNGNYSQYYRNDIDFLVDVIKKEEAPHDFRIKLQKQGPHSADLSKSDMAKILADFKVTDFELTYGKYDDIIVDIRIDDSTKAADIYYNLYKYIFRAVRGYKSRVFYQRDIRVLEKYADEAAAKYYEEEEKKKSRPPPAQHHKEKFGYNKHRDNREHGDRRDHRDHKNNRYRKDEDTKSKKEEESASADVLPGFGSSDGPKLFFNKKKSELNTTGLKDVSKSNPVDVNEDDNKQDTTQPGKSKVDLPLEPIAEKSEKQNDSKAKTEGTNPPDLKRRDTDNEFEIDNAGPTRNPDKNESHTLVNKVDQNSSHQENEDWKKEESKVQLKGRHSQRGSLRANRSVYGAKYAQQTVEKHLNLGSDSQNSSTKQDQEKPTLIGDRPETEQFEEKAAQQNIRFSGISKSNESSGINKSQTSRGGYRHDNHGYDNRGRGGYKRGETSRGGPSRGGPNRGGYSRGGYKEGYERGRGYQRGYNNRGKNYHHNDTKTYYNDQRSQYSDKYDIESTHSQRSNRGNFH